MPEFGHKRHPGDRSLPAGAWNRLVAKTTQPNVQPPEIVNAPRDYDLCPVENTSGYDAEPFGVLQTKTATWEERENETFDREGMRRGVEIQGENVETEWDNVAVLQKSAPEETIMPGVISGPTPVRVLYKDATALDYPYAIPIPGDPEKLQASPFGRNRILWHETPDEPQSGCDPRVLQAYVNMGEDGQWVFFKLQGDLPCCGSTTGVLVDECGEQVGERPIVKTVWGPKTHEEDAPVCDCGSAESLNAPPDEADSGCWKEGDVLPFWWFQYLEKWVTIPKEQTGAAGPWSMLVTQPPQLVCEEGLDEDGNTVCTGALVITQKRLTVDGGCACLADDQPLALVLPTPELLGAPTLTIDTGDATGADDDPCTCSMATLTFPVTPMSWCDGCVPDAHTEAVSFPVPPEDGGRLEVVTDTSLVLGANCGDVQHVKTVRGYELVCGGLCPDENATITSETIRLFDTTELEYVSAVTLSNVTLALDTASANVVTGGAVTLSGGAASGTYLRPTGIDWTGVTFTVTLPTIQKTVVTSVSVDGCNVVGTTETIHAIDPNGAATVTMSGTPTVTTASATLSFNLSGLSASFTPTTTALNYVTGGTVSGGSLTVSKETETVLICPSGGSV